MKCDKGKYGNMNDSCREIKKKKYSIIFKFSSSPSRI